MTTTSFNNDSFKNPDKSYRPAPFWSLNGDLKDEHLLQQIKDFKEIGFGGYFMHPRPGMKTPYLEEEWFDRVKFMVETGQNEDMEPWLYDEDSYPSGFASGAIPTAKPELRAHAICLVTMEQLEEHPCIVAEYGFWKKNSDDSLTPSCKDDADIAIIVSRNIEGDSWYNNQCYVDTLNPETIQCFLESTHAEYAKRFKAEFGSIIPGIFTDEPHHSPSPAAGVINILPWTPAFPEEFSEKYNYDILKKLPALFYDIEGFESVRFDYFNLVNELFVNNFCKPMFDWCEENDLELTGHFWEHSYPNVKGQASILTPLKYMHRPGIDLLGRDVDKFSFDNEGEKLPSQVGNWQMVKVAGSVARQYGFNRVMSETWGGGGWDQTLEDHKQSADWEMLLGINYVVPHLSHYTLEGYRKADYPICFTRALPYWKQLHFLNDHIARVSYALSCGETPTQIMVIHPASHNWINYNDMANLNAHTKELEKLTRWLNTNQYEFDFGDEPLLAEDGWVKEGKIGIAKAGYDIVIIPPTICLHSTTVEMLQQFQNKGGLVIYFGENIPELANGRNSMKLREFFSNTSTKNASNFTQLAGLLEQNTSRLLNINSTHQKVMCMIRKDEEKNIFFIANFANKTDSLTLSVTESGKLYRANTETGELAPISEDSTATDTYKIELAAGQSQLLVLDTTESPYQDISKHKQATKLHELSGPFSYKCLDDNIMLLDHCHYAFNNESFSNTVQVEQALKDLKERYELEYSQGVRYPREYSMPEWTNSQDDMFNMRFSFDIEANTDLANAKLAIEIPKVWQITVNGQKASQITDRFFMDHCFGVLEIGDLLKIGTNEIYLEAKVTRDLAPANIFILGNFGVTLNKGVPTITQAPAKLALDDITSQGFPFFGGRITYQVPFVLENSHDNLSIKLAKLNAPIIDCKLDGNYAGKLFEAPYKLDLGNIEAGEHTLEITLYTHLKNVFGPHYMPIQKEQVIIGCHMYNHIHENSREEDLIITPCGVGEGLTLQSS